MKYFLYLCNVKHKHCNILTTRLFFISLAFAFFFACGSAIGQGASFPTSQEGQGIARYMHLTPKQLLDTANRYFLQNKIDEALLCFSLLTGTAPQSVDVEQKKLVIEAYISSANIHIHTNNYRFAYELLLNALQHIETINDTVNKSRAYISLGLIYHSFGKQELAKLYFSEALKYGGDSALVLNNIGYANVVSEQLDEAFDFLNQSLQVAYTSQPHYLYLVLHSLAAYYRNRQVHDSAYHYYHLALDEARAGNTRQHKRVEAIALSGLGNLFFEANKPNSAIHYINRSNTVAIENDLPGVQLENYLILSKIAESRGNRIAAFEYFKKYSDLKDLVFDRERIVEISEMHRRYEISRANQEIERLSIEQQVKNQTIRYQRTIQSILVGVLIVISIVLIFVFFQNRRLDTAYRRLFEKNLKIIELQKNSPETDSEKYQTTALSDEVQNELLPRIYEIMDDISVVCDADFSLDKLAELVGSNRVYISQIINDVLKKNFRGLINEYRIREAQRLFSEADTSKYTIESVALRTGYKSRTSFISAFKEATGVSPSFYVKALQEQT